MKASQWLFNERKYQRENKCHSSAGETRCVKAESRSDIWRISRRKYRRRERRQKISAAKKPAANRRIPSCLEEMATIIIGNGEERNREGGHQRLEAAISIVARPAAKIKADRSMLLGIAAQRRYARLSGGGERGQRIWWRAGGAMVVFSLALSRVRWA
jgi:hypothetical protein